MSSWCRIDRVTDRETEVEELSRAKSKQHRVPVGLFRDTVSPWLTPLVGAVVRPRKLPFDKLTVLDCNVSAIPPEAGGGSRLRVCGSHQSPRRARFVTPSERG